LLEVQAGALWVTVPVQVCVALPFAPSAVTGTPPWLQATATGAPLPAPQGTVPPTQGKVSVTVRLAAGLVEPFVTEKSHEYEASADTVAP
jgi:hypothetical protein